MKNNKKIGFAIMALSVGLLAPLKASLADADVAAAMKQFNADWQQWAWSIPTSVNPMLDTTGENCMVAQHGPVWFLAGFVSGSGLTKVTRSCTIPEGKWLFFPIANSVFYDSPGICGQGKSFSLKELRDGVKAPIDGIKKPTALIDGKPTKYMQRVQSPLFDLALPEENVFDLFCGDLGGSPAGVFPAVEEGYYAAVEPLKVGKHTIVIHAEGSFSQDITYNLTIVPVKLK